MLGKIYKITNKINGKVYIGQTIQSLNLRWRGHCQNINNGNYLMVIKKAIHKYGKENFTIEVIETCEETLLDAREKYWIAYYDSYRKGYNSTIGGKEHSKMSKLEKDAEDIVELYNTGFSLREIASQYNVDHATIKLILIRNNVKLRSTRTYKLTEGERQEIISKIEHGITRKEIMKEYHISKSYLSQLINGKRRI